jgi:hypothetical protein
MRRFTSWAIALLSLTGPAVYAQVATGNIYGTTSDESGAALSGANVTLSGVTGARTTTSGIQGDFRFLNLAPGSYKLTVALAGFTTVNREVRVQTANNVEVAFSLKVAAVEETVTVTAETPIVDMKKTGTTTNVTRDELEKVPQARDPWAVLRSVPGVVVDRVNIAGNESGQQAMAMAKGSNDDDTQWSIDGVVVTDMAATGASPTYFDFDAFEEIQYSTGGNDVKLATGGIALNFVTKRGTNSFHGGGRFFLTHDDLQSGNLPDELQNDARLQNPDGSFRDKADHIQQISDYGGDLGGPIVKDKLWFYGTYGVQDIRLMRLNGTPDKTLLKSYNAKLNWQVSPSDSLSAFWFWGKKEKYGRDPGVGLTPSDSFLWNQGDRRRDGTPPGLYKLEWNHIFSPNFFLNAKAGYYGTGFGLLTRGDIDEPGTLDFTTRNAIGSSLNFEGLRPQTTVNVDANYFKTALGGNHEFKFGFGYRHTPVDSITQYAGRMWGLYSGGGGLVNVFRDRVAKYESEYAFGYVGDTFSRDRLTVNLGLRFDHQTSNNVASQTPANPDFPELLPALDYDGNGTGINWDNLSPRVSVSYALSESRKTVVRASYSRYASQISAADGSFDNPNSAAPYLQYYWSDLNNDRLPQPAEVLVDQGLYYAFNIDPANPAAATAVNRIDPDYEAPTDDEVILGLDHELLPNFAVGAAYTWRSSRLNWQPRNGVTLDSYAPGTTLTRTNALGTFTGTSFAAEDALPGRFLTNRPDYSRNFSGAELSLVKRLSNKWMGRVAFSWNDWVENFDGGLTARNVYDPTRTQAIGEVQTNANGLGPLLDGGQVSILSGGSGKQQLFSSVKWQLAANALVQLPWDMEVSGALFGRQGHPRPTYLSITSPGEPRKGVLAEPTIDGRRYPDLWNLDLRLAKNIKVGGSSAVLSAECFNLLNSGVELTRTRDAASSVFNRLDEVLSPRVLRLGLRFLF